MKKRLIAIFVLTLFVMTSFAASFDVALASVEQTGEIKILHDNNYLINSYRASRCEKTVEYGIGGKSSEDAAVRFSTVEEYADTSWYAYSSWKNSGFGNYVVVEASIFVDENVNSFYLGTRQHNAIGATINVNSDILPNQWGKYVAVFDIAENTTDTYFNGYLINSNYVTNFNTNVNGTLFNDIRLIFGSPVHGNAWVSDYKVYEAVNEPVIVNDLYLEGYEEEVYLSVKEGTIFNNSFTKSIADASVRIYTDSTYQNSVTDNDPLMEGYRIVLEYNGEYRFYTVDVDDGITVEDAVDDGTIVFQRAAAETVNGAFGKAGDDISQRVISDSTLAAFSTYTWLDDDFEGYIRADFNIEPGNMKGIYIGTNVHKPVSDALTLNANQWNRVSVVYNTADYDAETGIGKAHTYVNGVLFSTVDTIFTNLGQMRVILSGGAGSYAYIDDFSFTTFAYGAPDIPRSDELDDSLEILNGYVVPDEGMTVADLGTKENTSVIRVFANSLCLEELGSDAELGVGNTIVVESADKVYNYYTAYDTANINVVRKIDDFSDKFAFTRGETASVTGLGGKDALDESIKITVTASDNDVNANAFNDIVWTNEGYQGYLTVEFNVYPVNATPTLATNGHTTISPTISNLVKNRWNKVVFIHDAASFDGSKGKSYLYVNGKYVGMSESIFTSGKAVRLIVNSGESIGGYLYIDDYRIYESDVLPIVSVPDISSYYPVNESTVAFEEGATPSSLSAGRLTLRVFEDETFTTQFGDEDAISSGNVVVAEDSFKTLSYYTVNNNVEKNYILSVSDTNIPEEIFKVTDATLSAAYGIHGRDVNDESIRLDLTHSNAYIQYIYDFDSSDSRYVTIEASAYTECDGQYNIASSGHQPISERIYVKDESGYKNQWTRIVFIFDKNEHKGYLYCNGTLIKETVSKFFPSDAFDMIRFVYYGAVGATVYLDDISIYECDVKPAVAKAAVVPASVRYILFNQDLYLPSDVRRSQLESVLEIDDELTEISVYKDGAAAEVGDEESLPDESLMTLKRGENLYTAYNVHITERNKGFFYGNMGKSGVLSDGKLKIAVPIENVADQPLVLVAGYKGGKLVTVAKPVAEGYTKHITYDLDVVGDECDSIKVMVWSCDNLMPYSESVVIGK